MSGTNVTYILGAGASCYSQPLVSNMKERMESLIALLNTNSDIHKKYICDTFKDKTEDLYKKYNLIVEEANKHYTPDTYAKKLSLTDQIDKLDLLKEFLNLYFLFEQDDIYDFYKDKNLPKNRLKEFLDRPLSFHGGSSQKDVEIYKLTKKRAEAQKDNFVWDKIKIPIDYRYDVFLATLLVNKGTKENQKLLLPENYNIISWNYDNQWEFAYKEYAKDIGLKGISKRLYINNKYDPNKSHILKVNGDCNCWDEEKNEELTFYNAVEKLISGKNVNNTIEFAWEGSKPQYAAIHKIMEKSDIIVIIGYSFPNFNRDVDKTIFFQYNPKTTKEIIIQVPDKYEFKKIKQRLQTIKPIDDIVFRHIPDKDQFYIPL